MLRIAALVVTILVTGLLVATNPDKAAFAAVVAESTSAELEAVTGLAGPIAGAFLGASRAVVEAAVQEAVRRDDFLVASLFRLPSEDGELRYLGILGTFVRLPGG